MLGLSQKVLELTANNFDKEVLLQQRSVLIDFYRPGCPHCVNLEKTWEETAMNLAGHIKVASVNCQTESELCQRYNIKGVPSIKLFTRTTEVNSSNSSIMVPFEFNGSQRTLGEFNKFVDLYSTAPIYKITSSGPDSTYRRQVDLKSFLEKGGEALPKFILFKTNTLKPSLPLKTLSLNWFEKILLAICDMSKDSEYAKKYQIDLQKDAFIMIKGGMGENSKVTRFEGPLTFTELNSFIKKSLEKKENGNKMEL